MTVKLSDCIPRKLKEYMHPNMNSIERSIFTSRQKSTAVSSAFTALLGTGRRITEDINTFIRRDSLLV